MGTEREISTITGKPKPTFEEKDWFRKFLTDQRKLPAPGERVPGVWPFEMTPKKYFKEASIYNPPKGMLDPVGAIHVDDVVKNLTQIASNKLHPARYFAAGSKNMRKEAEIFNDLFEDYIRKIPQKVYDPIGDVRYGHLPSKVQGTFRWNPRLPSRPSEIIIDPRKIAKLETKYNVVPGAEGNAMQAAKILAHEGTHSATGQGSLAKPNRARIEIPILKARKDAHKKGIYWDSPFEIMARRVSKRFVEDPSNFESIYHQEAARVLPKITDKFHIPETSKVSTEVIRRQLLKVAEKKKRIDALNKEWNDVISGKYAQDLYKKKGWTFKK